MRLDGEVLKAIETMNGEAERKEKQSRSQQRESNAGNPIEVEHSLMCELPLNTRRWAWLASYRRRQKVNKVGLTFISRAGNSLLWDYLV